MRIALAQINPTVGDIAGNAELIHRDIDKAREQGAALVVFPELAIIGYPPRDLLLKPAVIERCIAAVEELALACTDIDAIIGYPAPSTQAVGRQLHNAAAHCHEGRLVDRFIKTLLPTYDVFDESRYFEPGRFEGEDGSVDESGMLHGVRLGVSICEDLWNEPMVVPRQLYHGDPIARLAKAGAQVLINCSASPYVVDKHAFRLKLFAASARRHHLPVLYCNQVGGNDELIFDGNSCAIAADGTVIAQAKDFEPDLLVIDLPIGDASAPSRSQGGGGGEGRGDEGLAPTIASPSPFAAAAQGEGKSALLSAAAVTNRLETSKAGIESMYHALVLGLRDYCRKCGFKAAVLGLSGGIDSAVTAALCVAALGSEHVRGVAMPSRYSSVGSVADAAALAMNLAIRFDTIAIDPAHKAFEAMLTPQFEGRPPDTAEENVQARIRGVILMALSNKFGSLLVTTGNKSELAVGYCTLYGDMAGGLAILSDVPKTLVWKLARWINDDPAAPLRKKFRGPVIPENSISKPPSAELRPNQTDQDSLPPYELLDQIIERYIEQEQSAQQIIDELEGADEATVQRVVRLIDINEYKRKQMPPGLKVTGRAFGIGRRMPIAQRYDNRIAAKAHARE